LSTPSGPRPLSLAPVSSISTPIDSHHFHLDFLSTPPELTDLIPDPEALAKLAAQAAESDSDINGETDESDGRPRAIEKGEEERRKGGPRRKNRGQPREEREATREQREERRERR
jgi:hypothetical protein